MTDKKIIVAGIGPGDKKFITPAALEKIRAAKFLVGGRRALETFSSPSQITCPVTKNLDAVINFIREKILIGQVVVMVSGDPGYYSMLDILRRNFDAALIEVIPSISALQFAFAKLALSWYDATLLSFHGRRPTDDKLKFEPQKVLGLLTDAEYNSATISKILIELGWVGDTNLAICARLSYPDEKIISTTLAAAVNSEPVKHCVLIVGY
mgnify:CR=1 FL=1